MTRLRAVLTLACVLVGAVNARGESPATVDASTPPAARTLTERSVYQLESRWTTDAGQNIPLAQLVGQYQIVAFIFTHCAAACPLIVKSLQLQSRSMPAQARERARFLLVSIDPQNDTVAALRAYRKEMGLDAQWTLLRGKEDDVRELAAVLGFNYDRMPNGQFAHSTQITLLDPGGEIVLQHPSPEGAVEAMSAVITTCRGSTGGAGSPNIAGKNCP